MAACVADMYDVAMKPRLLDLLRDKLPDELSEITRAVRTHQLLSEPSSGDSADEKVVKGWASAVAKWVDWVLVLASSNSPIECRAGVSLLGLTCQECSPKRFLESYPLWIEKLQPHIEPATDSHMVKLAACASLGDLLVRLGQYPLRHGKGGFADKLVQQSLNLLNEESSEDILDVVLRLIGIMATLFPYAIQRHYDSAEATIISKIFSGRCSNFLLEKLARCLAVLPKSKGGEGTWSLLMQKILLFVNDYLKDAFEDLEEENKSGEFITLLFPPGKNPPPPLTDCKSKPASRSKQTSIVSAMMICCSEMIKTSSPAEVSGFMRPLQALIDRVLMVDGSIPQTSLFVTAMQQELLCLRLPVLHSSVLDLQIALIKCMRSEMATRAPYIFHVITRYFKKCALPDLRVKVYSVIKTLLMSAGGGMAMNVKDEIMKNALVDLNPDHEKKITHTQSNATNTSGEQRSRKKRKRPSTTEPPGQQQNADLELHAIKSPLMEHPEVKIAALETLEVLFTEGGSVKLGKVDVDDVLISHATKLFDPQRPSSEELQLAALRALLASTLSQRVRPPHFARSRELFQRGRQASLSKVGEFCAHSKLALVPLIHPQALPLSDYSAPPPVRSSARFDYSLSEKIYSTAQKHSSIGFGLPDSDNDNSGAWLDEEVKGTKPAQDTPTTKSLKKKQKKKQQRFSDGSSDENAEENNGMVSPVMVSAEKIMLNPEAEPLTSKSQEPASPGPVMIPCTSRTTKEAKEDTSDDEGTVELTKEDTSEDEETGLGGNAVVNGQDDAPLSASHGADSVMPDLDKGKEQLKARDHGSADDEYPDIIDMDPDE